jgi:CBS-domain-containing membrane protein
VRKFFDAKFRRIPGHYVVQCLMATVAIGVVLVLMDAVEQTALIASLGASAFIAFTMPQAHVSEPRYLIGGYIVGVVVGVAFGLTYRWLDLPAEGASQEVAHVVLGGLAVGVAIFLMVVTNTEHPPAAGIALGLVINQTWDALTLVVILSAICSLSLVKWLLRRYLRNLL